MMQWLPAFVISKKGVQDHMLHIRSTQRVQQEMPIEVIADT